MSTSSSEHNKRVVLDFYDKAINRSDIEAAGKHFGKRYVQHSPGVPDGIDGFKLHFKKLKQQFPHLRGEIKRVIAEGDLVVLHTSATMSPEQRGLAMVDIFRLEDGKIVEHWDVRQALPETSLNDNGMF